MKVLVCDDDTLLSGLLCDVLVARGHETRAVSSPADAVAAVRSDPPDVCVLDVYYRQGEVELPGTATEKVLAARPGTPVLVLTGAPHSPPARHELAAGARGLLDKSRPLEVLVSAVERVAAGERLVESSVLSPGRAGAGDLTRREEQVLRLLGQGASSAEIAESMGISGNTVRKHVQRLLDKLGARSRLEAVAEAVRRGLLPASPSPKP